MASSHRTILITGGTSGVGYQCALQLAKQCPTDHIVICSRTDNFAATSINKITGVNNVQFLPLDLASLDNVRSFAVKWKSPINALVLNAGLQFPSGIHYSKDGYEATFAINHVGHALLCFLLRPHLTDTAHVVLTASGVHDPAQKSGLPDAIYETAEELAHPNNNYAGRQRYATSKLVNVMWSYLLHRRLKQTVVSFDPGLVPGTGLARETGPILRFLWHRVLPHILPLLRVLVSPNIHTPEESGTALAWLAVGDDIEKGKYYEGRKVIKSSDDSYDERKQEDLWEWTVKNVTKNQEEEVEFRTFT